MKAGQWIREPFEGSANAECHLALVEDKPTNDDWRPAYHESHCIMVRCPVLVPGSYWLWKHVVADGHTIVSQIRIVNVE